MTDKKDPSRRGTVSGAPPEDDLDWDAALDEWEQKFVPEVAQDKETKKPATLTGSPLDRPSRPLYRPPPGPIVPPPRSLPRTQSVGAGLPRPAKPPPPHARQAVSSPLSPPQAGVPAASQGGVAKPLPVAIDVAIEPDFDQDLSTTVVSDGPEFDIAATEAQEPAKPEPVGFTPADDPPGDDIDRLLNESARPQPRQPSAIDLTLADVELVDPALSGATAGRSPSIAEESSHSVPGPVSPPPAIGQAPVPSPLPVLAPEEREHDPDAQTASRRMASFAPPAREEATEIDRPLTPRGPAPNDDEDPTRAYERPVLSAKPGKARSISNEATAEFVARAEWMEAEARTMEGDSQARALLSVSELYAIAGDAQRAYQLAAEARDLAPRLPLSHRQVRALMPSPRDPDALVAALELEARHAPSNEARAHAVLLAADVLRSHGDETAAARLWADLAANVPDDIRAPLASVAHALARGEIDRAAEARAGLRSTTLASGLLRALSLRGATLAEEGTEDRATTASNSMRRAREALDSADVVSAAQCIGELRKVPELARSAAWLSAALGATRRDTRANAAVTLKSLLEEGEELARPLLAALAIELGDSALVEAAIQGGAFSTADRAVLGALVDTKGSVREPDIEALAIAGAMAPLASAIAATAWPRAHESDGPVSPSDARARQVDARADHVAGTEASRHALRLARLVGADAPSEMLREALTKLGPGGPTEAASVALELGVREGKFAGVSDTVKSWASADDSRGRPSDAKAAAALIAERAGYTDAALSAYREARAADPTNEAVLRAIASLDPATELPQELNELADALVTGTRAALARLEAVVREQDVDDATRADLLERAHTADPTLPMPSFLAERIARRSGNVEDVLRWIAERRSLAGDPLERALDCVREALLIADRDPELAAQRLEEAHRSRPDDVALRELFERLSREPPPDRAPWREQRAAAKTGNARALYFMEAAHEYERVGDRTGSLRAAEAAVASGDSLLARLARERAELEGGSAGRLADELLAHARATESARERREAYERLADIDGIGRGDPASALLWHRSILEETPDYQPSLRHIEHALIGDGRDDELEPITASIARALATTANGNGDGDPECVAHADLATRLRSRGATGDWESTYELATLATSQPQPSITSLRLLNAHARARRNDAALVTATIALVDRATRPSEIASLLVRAGEAASRAGDLERAREMLERSKTEDPGDVVTWGLLADVRQRAGDPRGAAEACESLARTSVVPAHQLPAWYDAARFWLDDVHDMDRGIAALEQAASLDIVYEDVFPRLSALYASRGARNELAGLLERRIATIVDPQERVAMEVDRGRALLDVGDTAGAREALKTALDAQPDHVAALIAYGELSAKEHDWDEAEQAWVRLARLLTNPDEQRDVYARLGELYSVNSVNLARAELAFKEVLKRAPGDIATLEHLVDIYRRQNDAGRAIELVQQLILQAKDSAEKRQRLVELSSIHESQGHDPRRAEQVLEGARREFPTDVTVLRALAEFYIRHKQMPAVHILLDRAAADARRAFAAGRFAPALFEVMRAVFELRGKKDASLVVAATLAAIDGQPASVRGADARALDPRLDDRLAPEVLSPALRSLLAKAGGALDAAIPLDLRALHAAPLPQAAQPLAAIVSAIASTAGMPNVKILVSPQLGKACVPVTSEPPTLVVGEALLSAVGNERARTFMMVRALKLLLAHASALVRIPATDLAVLVSAWLHAFNPTWTPSGINPAMLAAAAKRIAAAVPRSIEPVVGMLALEVAGSIGTQAPTLGTNALAWANRAALLAVGDPNAALDAIAWSHGAKEAAPTDPQERSNWISRTHEAKDLLAFSVSDAYADARNRVGLDKI
jgi:predicted Zn-dependent protease